MAILAIKGHATRGSEVIGLLEMLGGKNIHNCEGFLTERFYYINNGGCIDDDFYNKTFTTFTLEEFLEKYPYKVGDKVNVCGENAASVIGMRWESDYVVYRVRLEKNGYETSKMVEGLQPYTEQKEETMEEKKTPKTQEEVNEYLLQHSVKNAMNLLDIEKCLNNDGFGLPNGVMVKYDGIGSIEFIRWYEKLQYPKTYEECLKVLGYMTDMSNCKGYKGELLESFQRLLVCRDAYYKIAGDWKPNLDFKQRKFALSNVGSRISFEVYGEYNSILCFPTSEMRDAFYENFKELIEEVKELL